MNFVNCPEGASFFQLGLEKLLEIIENKKSHAKTPSRKGGKSWRLGAFACLKVISNNV
jgi:hypothetical protein